MGSYFLRARSSPSIAKHFAGMQLCVIEGVFQFYAWMATSPQCFSKEEGTTKLYMYKEYKPE